MEVQSIRLWTWHKRDFCLVSDRVDHSRSAYYNYDKLPGIRVAYKLLADRLRTDQFIWCYHLRDEHHVSNYVAENEIEWELEIPKDKVLAFIDGKAWDNIIRSATVFNRLPDSLFLEDVQGGHASVLVEIPVPEVWVKQRTEVVEVLEYCAPITKQKLRAVSVNR
jgi:hypothetical protein